MSDLFCTIVSSFNPSAVNGSSSSVKDSLIPFKTTSKQLDTSINLCSSLDEFILMRTAVKSSSLKPLSQLCQGLSSFCRKYNASIMFMNTCVRH